MHTQILTSKYGGELISFKLNGKEKIHQEKPGHPYLCKKQFINDIIMVSTRIEKNKKLKKEKTL